MTEKLIEEIIKREWKMFDAVNNIGGRAACQNDWKTFHIMRSSAFCILQKKTLQNYLQDLIRAEGEGRNLLTEKYAYMMKSTDPDYFKEYLEPFLPVITPQKSELAKEIAEILTDNEQDFRKDYPLVSGKGRTLTGSENWASFHTYLLSELNTYSENTLQCYYEDVTKLLNEGKSPSFLIHEKTAILYGYDGVEALERSLR